MTECTGVVQAINTKPVSGNRLSYDVVVAGAAYGAGLYAPKCKVGDYVKFEIDDSRGYKNIARNSLKVSKHKPPAEAVAQAASTAVKAAASSFDNRQDTISRQAATNTAIEFMKLLRDVDALGLPTGAKGNKQAAMETMLHKYTQEFYERNTGTAFKDITPNKEEKIDAAVKAIVEEPEEVVADNDEWQ